MRSYGEIEVTRSGALAIALEAKKLRLQPPVPTKARERKLEDERELRNGSRKWRNVITKKTEIWTT